MRSIGFVVAVGLAAVVLSAEVHAGLYFEQEVKTPAQPGMPATVSKQVCYLSGPKMRIETTTMGMTSIVIQRHDLGKTYNLMPQNKIYMEMQIPKPPTGPSAPPPPKVTVTKTEETKKVGKYLCTRYDVTIGSEVYRFWMTEEVDVNSELTDYWRGIMRSDSPQVAREMAKIKGFPMVIEMSVGGKVATATVTKVEKRDIPDSLFEVPADYRPMPMPGGSR